jgi:H+/Cl- antiporter ClcA
LVGAIERAADSLAPPSREARTPLERSLVAHEGSLVSEMDTRAQKNPPARALVDRAGLGPFSLALLAIALGVVAGMGALVFRALIALCHNLLFLGIVSTDFDTNRHTAIGPWGPAVAFAPAVAAVVVVFLVKNFAPEAKGHGVPEVMDAIYYKKGVIRPVVAVIKSLASAISIGSGGSVGREGPIIQIGAAFGSWAGQTARVSRWQLATLVAAGGGAGIAATFNTPIGGVLFAVEVLLHEVSVRTLVPVALATATATYVGHFLFGDHPAFSVPALHMPEVTTAALLPAYLALGAVMAFVSVLFIRALYGSEDLFEKWIPKRDYLRHVSGMLVVGALAESLMVTRALLRAGSRLRDGHRCPFGNAHRGRLPPRPVRAEARHDRGDPRLWGLGWDLLARAFHGSDARGRLRSRAA